MEEFKFIANLLNDRLPLNCADSDPDSEAIETRSIPGLGNRQAAVVHDSLLMGQHLDANPFRRTQISAFPGAPGRRGLKLERQY
jgi:hypothetical protein